MAIETVNLNCPFCMQQHDFSRSYECPETGEIIPDDYFDAEPIFLLTVGFSRHGKTVYVSALTLMLEEISTVWRRVTIDYLDEYTLQAVRTMRYLDRQAEQPNPSPAAKPRPLLMRINNLPKVGTRNLVIYDVGGELFAKPEELHAYIPALSQVKTCWFFISLRDLYSDQNINTLGDLFAAYAKSMQRLNAPLSGHKLIAVYTKADEITFDIDIDKYVLEDPLRDLTNRAALELPSPSAFEWDKYIGNMTEQSRILRSYTERKLRGGAAFIDRAEDAGMEVRFCAISALGAATNDKGQMQQQVSRYRVIDPFLWSVLLNIGDGPPPPPTRSMALILDASAGGSIFFDDNLPTSLVAQLGGANSGIQTYYLGQSGVAVRPGQAQPTHPPKVNRALLIGPVFEAVLKQHKGEMPATVVISHKEILDLSDYQNSAWLDHVLLVIPEQMDGDWDQFIYQGASDLSALALAIKRKFKPK